VDRQGGGQINKYTEAKREVTQMKTPYRNLKTETMSITDKHRERVTG
jgi:hypothetical protein